MPEQREVVEPAAWIPSDMDFGTQLGWSKYCDGQGPSTQTPLHLKGLFNPDLAQREQAMSSLYTTLFHQGMRFEPSVKAVPILFEIAERGDCPALAFVVEYLLALAYGYTSDIGPDGVDPVERISALEKQAGAGDDARAHCLTLEPLCEPKVALALYKSIYEGRFHIAALMNHQSPEVAAHAVIATALLCANDDTIRQKVIGRLQRAMVGETFEVQAAAVVAAGAMARAVGDKAMLNALSSVFEQQSDPRLRFLAAIGLATPEQIGLYREALTWGLCEWSGEDAPAIETVWASPRRLASERIALCLQEADDGDVMLWVEGFAARVEQSAEWSAFAAADALLRLIRPCEDLGFGHVRRSDLTTPQCRGLQALRDSGFWRRQDASGATSSAYLNYVMTLKTFGLPASQEALTAYLRGDRPTDWLGPI